MLAFLLFLSSGFIEFAKAYVMHMLVCKVLVGQYPHFLAGIVCAMSGSKVCLLAWFQNFHLETLTLSYHVEQMFWPYTERNLGLALGKE